jgi:tetratricopeptide (TPR) repeat protein
MTSSANARPRGRFRRRVILLAAVVLFLLATTAGAIFYWNQRSSAGPIPPLVPENPAEPGIAAVVEKVRGEVLRQPRSAQAWGRLGQVLLANDLEPEAQICFAEAERLDPDNPRWPYYQAGFLLNQGEREAALPFLQRAVERCAIAAPDNPTPRLMLAETLLALGRLEEAETHFHQVMEQHPDNIRAHYDMGLAASVRQDWQASRTHLLRCLGNPFAQQKACAKLAFVSQCLGDSDNAEKFRQQASRLPADQEWDDSFVTEYLTWAVTKRNRLRLAESLEASGQLRQAAAVVRPMISEYPDDYLPRWFLGKILGQIGQSREAEEVLREALRLAPEKVQVRYYLGLVLFTQASQMAENGDAGHASKIYQEAVQRAREALAIKPDYGLAYMVLGLSLKGLGQRADALAALRQAVRCNPEHAELHYYLGDLLAEDGRSKEAREQLEQAIAMAPPNAPWKIAAENKLTAENAEKKHGEKQKENY